VWLAAFVIGWSHRFAQFVASLPRRERFYRYLPAWVMLAMVLVIVLPNILGFGVNIALDAIRAVPHSISRLFAPPSKLAPLFTKEVAYWSKDIQRWASDYDLDPNLLATVMQIESCGHPTVSSSAGAAGLFQVMPFHFDPGENQLDPDTNAKRGADFLQQCLGWAKGDSALGMACYNGGPSVLQTNYLNWSDQTQRYYWWAKGIYTDALDNRSSSDTLNRWLDAGGSRLCQRAAGALGIQ
jgi:soluble lytic murein transglycosylase-like protein